MKRGTPRHPKTLKLARELRVPISQAVGILEMLWHFTAEFCPRGDIGRMDDGAILESFGESPENSGLLQTLVICGWIDRAAEFRLVVHDWHDHCDDYTKRKLKKHGLTFASENFQKIPDDSGLFTATVPCLLPVPCHAVPERNGEQKQHHRRADEKPDDAAGDFAKQIQTLAGLPRLSKTDLKLCRDLEISGTSMDVIRSGLLIGRQRRMVHEINHSNQNRVKSLQYFASVIEEAKAGIFTQTQVHCAEDWIKRQEAARNGKV